MKHLIQQITTVECDMNCEKCLNTRQQFPPGHGCSTVALVFHEGKASILALVSCTGVNNHLHHTIRHLPHLSQDLLFLLGFWDASHKQPAVIHTCTHAQQTTVPKAKSGNDPRFDETQCNL